MTDFINIIKFIAEKYNTIIPTSFLVFFTQYCLGSTTLTDNYIFKFYINNNALFDENEQNAMTEIYTKSKNLKNILKKYIYRKKTQKYNKSDVQHDLYFVPLVKYPRKQLIEIIENKTIYTFRISNLINMWMDALSKQENLFAKPIKLKNPYTNLPFSKHNLYNIFFSIKYSGFYIPDLIHYFFISNFNLDSFVFNHYPIVKEYIIKNYIAQSSTYELYESIHNMLHKYKNDLDGVYLPDYVTYGRKKKVIKDFMKFLPSYLISEYSCNPLKKRIMNDKIKTDLKKFINDNEIYYLRREPVLNLDSFPPPPPFNAPEPPAIEIQNTSRNNATSLLTVTGTNISRLQILTETQAFNPLSELPRTPPQQQQTRNVRPYSLNLFNSR
jgi:hypothetical protein